MKKLLIAVILFTASVSTMAISTVPKDTLKADFSTFLDMNSKLKDNSAGASIQITSKSAVYFRYGVVGFDMKKISSMREKVELGLFFYQSTGTDDFFGSTTATEFPLAVYAMKRKPSLPTNYTRFFNKATDNPVGDGFVIAGTFPKMLDVNDGQKIGVITVKKTDKDNFVKLDVTNFVNQYINGTDSIYFFLTSDATVNGTNSVFIRSASYGPVSAPKLYCYDEKPVAVMQGGRNIFVGEKDSVHVYFPSTAMPPYSVTYTDGTTPVTVNNITTRNFAFQVAPTSSVAYSLLASSDANGSMAVDGSAVFNILTPTATLSGTDKIYAGQSSKLTVDFAGIPPFSFSYIDHTGTPVTKTGIIVTKYEFSVSPTATKTYTLSLATDKNNASISTIGNPTISVIAVPIPVLNTGANDWAVVVSDEFGNNTLNPKMWSVTNGSPVVVNDELHLPVNISGTSYVGSQVKLIDKLPNNTDIYIETRIKPLNAKGATTLCWTQTYNTALASKYENRYVMSFPYITYRANNEFDYYYNLDNWKTSYYVADINPNKQYFSVNDSLKAQSQTDYKVFGISISSQDIVYYIDGVEVKRASTMDGYNSGELVDAFKTAGIGSVIDDVAKKAYGYYGQDGWNYNAGYAGDFMAFLLGTSVVAADADQTIDGKYAAVDYLRIFNHTTDLNNNPDENISFDNSTNVTLTGGASKSSNSISVNTGGSATFSLSKEYNLNTTDTRYFSTIVKKSAGAEMTLSLLNSAGKILTGTVIDQYNQLKTGFGENKVYYASTVSAEPTGRKSSFIRNDEASLLVGRIQTSELGDDYLSISILPLMSTNTQPYFYPNIEGEYGHTSYNNDWDLNYRYEIGTDKFSKINISGNNAESSIQKFIVGNSFESILPKESFAAFNPNLFYVAPGTQVNMEVQLKGTSPWNLTYTDGTQNYSISNITTSSIFIPVTPTKSTTYTLTALTDGNGLPGIVFGKQFVKVKSDRAMTIYPVYDSYVNGNSVNSFYNTTTTGNIKKASYAREAFFRYDISGFSATDLIDMGAFSVYFISNDKGAPVVLSLYYIDGGLPGDIVDLCWANKPNDINYKLISEITLPDPGISGIRANWDISPFINKKLNEGITSLDFCVKSTGGETASLLTWRQYSSSSTQYESQFPRLELDPYIATGINPLYSNNNNSEFLKISPNPVRNGFFKIDASIELSNVRIFNLTGVMVSNPQVVNGRVDVKGLAKGTYLIQANNAGRNFRAKLMIQ
jgi:hypothetical protein